MSGSGTYEARYGLWFSIRISPSRGWLPVCVGGREVIVSGAAHEARVRRRHGHRRNDLVGHSWEGSLKRAKRALGLWS